MREVNSQRSVYFYQLVAQISARFVEIKAEHIDQTIQQTLTDIGNFFHADRSYIFEFSDNLRFADNTFEWCAEAIPPAIDDMKDLPMEMYREWIQTWQQGHSIPVTDVSELAPESPERQLLEPQGMRSLIMVPLLTENALQGIFGIDRLHEPYEWHEEEVMLLRIVGEIISSAMHRKREDESSRLRLLISSLAVRFINLSSEKLNETIKYSLDEIKRFLSLQDIHFEAQQENVTASAHLDSKFMERGHIRLPVIHGDRTLGYISARHESRRLFEQAAIREALQLIVDLIAGSMVRRDMEEQVAYLAYFDGLTGAANRTSFKMALERVLHQNEDTETQFAVFLVDLDQFKRINDSAGREEGDFVLLEVTRRIREMLSFRDQVARFANDQFAVLLALEASNIEGTHHIPVTLKAEAMLQVLSEPYRVHKRNHHCTASIGVVVMDEPDTADSILKQAELAMYRAKARGRNCVHYYDPSLQKEATDRALLYGELYTSIQQRHFQLYYQPQVNVEGRVIGAEALVRWQHPDRGLLAPGEFIQFAEETKLILPLGEYVLQEACRQISAWHAQGIDLPIAVNVSAVQLLQSDFPEMVKGVLAQTQAPANRLRLEITESAMIEDNALAMQNMHELVTEGIGFSLDDFGTGYSSLSYLKILPIDEIKLDLRFVRDILKNEEDEAIARMVVELAEQLGLAVIAEGIESTHQRDMLVNIGCRHFQGYLFSKPLAETDFFSFLKG